MSKRGGARPGAGRKPKADEQRLMEILDPLEPLAQKALKEGLNDGQHWAVKLWFEYYYGKPNTSIELSGNTDTVIRFKDAE
jgi:hypothetical protein